MSTATLAEQKPDLQQALDLLIEMMNTSEIEGARRYPLIAPSGLPDNGRAEDGEPRNGPTPE